MQKTIKYTIFKTKWGYFGLAATDNGLLHTVLPLSNPEKVKRRILRASFVGRESSIENRASPVRRSFSEGRSIEFDKYLFKTAQGQIAAYFEGARVDFRTIPVVLACPERSRRSAAKTVGWGLYPTKPVVSTVEPSRGNGLGLFAKRVLTACRSIEFGQTVTYGQLAKIAGKPGSARAVGGALAKNPLPLIIPCHRVICSNGTLGGFSATGGINLKKRMLDLEEIALKL